MSVLRLVASCLMGILVGLASLPAEALGQTTDTLFDADPTSYTAFHLEPPDRIRDRIPGALWQSDVDYSRVMFFPNRAVAIGRRQITYVRSGRLLSREIRTGRVVWQVGSGLVPAILQHQDVVYAARRDGTVLAFMAMTGRQIWSTRTGLRDIDRFALIDGLLLANSHVHGLLALHPKTGARAWPGARIGYGSFGPQISANGIIIAMAVSGEPLVSQAFGIHARDGRVLWRRRGNWLPVAIRENLIYLRDDWSNPDLWNTFTIDVLALRTGELRRSFNHDLRPSDPRVTPRYERALIQDEDVYLDMGCAVYRLRLGNPKPTVYGIRGTGCREQVSLPRPPSWLAGPYKGWLFLWDGKYLYRLALAGWKTQTYTAVNGRVSRLLLIGNRIYAGQVDGWFKILDLESGAELFRAQTGGRNFDIKVGSGVVAVQAEHRLIVFPDP